MKKLHLQVAALLCLLGLASTVSAGDRGYRQDAGYNIAQRWKLGEPYRGGYAVYAGNRGYWERMPGAAIDVGQGWVIGTDRRRGGYGIYRWNGYAWNRVPGAAVSIGGNYERPWVINDRDEKFYWNGYDWDRDRNYGRAFNRNSYREPSRYSRERRGRNRSRGW